MMTFFIRKENVNDLKIRNISKEIRNFKKEDKNTRDPQAKIDVNNWWKKIQRFLTTNTFCCLKENHVSRENSSVKVNVTVIANPEDIVRTMQEWYGATAQHTTLQTTSLQKCM
jgi:hypothetical protein